MRFQKSEVLEEFDRQDRCYRLAILSSHWLRDTAPFKPSAAEEARGLQMEARGRWISYADLAEILEQAMPREIATSDFLLNQLHALIRAPFELLSDYCEDYDKAVPAPSLVKSVNGGGSLGQRGGAISGHLAGLWIDGGFDRGLAGRAELAPLGLLEPVAVAVHLQDVDVVGQPIEQRTSIRTMSEVARRVGLRRSGSREPSR